MRATYPLKQEGRKDPPGILRFPLYRLPKDLGTTRRDQIAGQRAATDERRLDTNKASDPSSSFSLPAASPPNEVGRDKEKVCPPSRDTRYSRHAVTTGLARLLLAVAGLFVCFRGYSAFHFGLGVTAFLVGAYAATTQYASLPPDPSWLALAAIAAAGFVLALLVLALYRVGVFLLGAIAGVLAALALPQLLPVAPGTRDLVLLAAAIVGGILSSLLERLALTVVTSIVGGLMISSAIFRPGGAIPLDGHIPNVGVLWADRLFLGTWAAFAVLGLVVQFGLPRRRRHPEGSPRT